MQIIIEIDLIEFNIWVMNYIIKIYLENYFKIWSRSNNSCQVNFFILLDIIDKWKSILAWVFSKKALSNL